MITDSRRQQTLDHIENQWRKAFKPAERISVSDWCEQNLIVGRDSAWSGPLDLDRTPWTRQILDDFGNDSVEQITLMFAAQCAKSLSLMGMVGFAVDQMHANVLFVMPNEKLAGDFAEERLDPLILSCPNLRKHILQDKDKYKKLEKLLDTSTITLSGSNSASSLSSRPVRIAIVDETDKVAEASEKESDALSLVRERTTTFWNKKIVITSTPTITTGKIYREFQKGSQSYFHVPCPFCHVYQPLIFDHLKWPDTLKNTDGVWDLDGVRKQAYYECAHCQRSIQNKDKSGMLKRGRWISQNPSARHKSYALSKLYPTWITFGMFAEQFLISKGAIDTYRNYYNSWRGEPWEEKGEQAGDDEVLSHITTQPEGYSPLPPLAVVLTADVSKSRIWFVIRAWCERETSFLLHYGSLPDLEALLSLSRNVYKSVAGDIRVTHGFIDSGWDTDRIYKFGKDNQFFPWKAENKIDQPIKWSSVEGNRLFLFRPDHFKDALQNKWKIPPNESGSFNLHSTTGRDYAAHLTAEISIEKTNKIGVPIRVWKRIRFENHLLDCEVAQLAAASALNIRFATTPVANISAAPQCPQPVREQTRPSGQFVRDDGRGYWDVLNR